MTGVYQMINMQFLDGVLLALAVLVGAAIALSVAMLAVGSASNPGPAPQGGIRPDLPQGGIRPDLPQDGIRPDLPQDEIWLELLEQPQSDTDDARVLVLR
jgi:hypothetical protein